MDWPVFIYSPIASNNPGFWSKHEAAEISATITDSGPIRVLPPTSACLLHLS
jgi:hypothetical protein